MSPTDLDDRIREVVSHIGDRAPAPMSFVDVLSRPLFPERSAERTHRRGLVAAAAALALVLAVTGAILWTRSDAGTTKQPAANLSFTHEIVEYSQTAQLSCPSGAPKITGTFDRMRLETWGSVELGRFRTQVTYPDGSTRDRMIEGNPFRVKRTLVRGQQLGRNVLGCEGEDTTNPSASEPAQTIPGSLNVLAPVPTGTDGRPIARIPSDGAIRIGPVTDTRGRTAILWREDVNGFSGAGRAIEQREEWFLDPSSNLVLEHRERHAVAGLGETTTRSVLVEHDTDPVDSAVFDPGGYRAVLGADVDQSLATAPTTAVVATVGVGRNWIWPAVPRRETPAGTARRFAQAVLGWNGAKVITTPGPTGPTFMTITQSGRTPLRILVIPTPNGEQKIQQIGDGVGTSTKGFALAFESFPTATRAEITSAPGGTLRAWRSVATVRGQNAQTTDIVKTGPAILILFRDRSDRVVGANGEVIGG